MSVLNGSNFAVSQLSQGRRSESSLAVSSGLRFFASIPPERVGIGGDYDHNGLAKRVVLALQEKLDANDLHGLSVSQRGAVVVLMGTVRSRSLLERVVRIARDVYGAADIESVGVRVPDAASYESQREFSFLLPSSYAC